MTEFTFLSTTFKFFGVSIEKSFLWLTSLQLCVDRYQSSNAGFVDSCFQTRLTCFLLSALYLINRIFSQISEKVSCCWSNYAQIIEYYQVTSAIKWGVLIPGTFYRWQLKATTLFCFAQSQIFINVTYVYSLFRLKWTTSAFVTPHGFMFVNDDRPG